MSRSRAWVDEAPRAARCHTQRFLVARSEAADGEEDGNGDESDGCGEDDVEPDVEVGALGDPANLEEERVNVGEGEAEIKRKEERKGKDGEEWKLGN